MTKNLKTSDHSRDIIGLKYVYPVISRRAGGLSIGINFNPNNACNWRCIYCQVPGLVRGSAPEMDLITLEKELRYFLELVIHGDFFEQFEVPEQQRVIKDIAISGNGEPTSLDSFDKAIRLIAQIATEMQVFPQSDWVLITNGSLIHKQAVQRGLSILNEYQGQVWFKLDSATDFGRNKINQCKQGIEKTLENLILSVSLCETRLQTCMVGYFDAETEKVEQTAYLDFLKSLINKQVELKKIMLYTLARPSLQPEANQLNKLDLALIKQFAEQIKALGYSVSVS